MIYQQLSTNLSAQAAQSPITTLSPPPQQAHAPGYVGWPQFHPQQPVHCAVPTIVYWYP